MAARPPPTLLLSMVIEYGIDRDGVDIDVDVNVDIDVGISMLATTFSMSITMSQTIYNATESVGSNNPMR